MRDIGGPELIIVLLALVLLFGAKRLPDTARGVDGHCGSSSPRWPGCATTTRLRRLPSWLRSSRSRCSLRGHSSAEAGTTLLRGVRFAAYSAAGGAAGRWLTPSGGPRVHDSAQGRAG